MRGRHFLPADWHSLKTIVRAVLRLRQPLVLVVLRRTVAKVLSMGLVVANVLPVLGREVVEGARHRTVLGQAGHRLVVLGAIGLEEEIEGLLRVLLGLGHPDVL